ncbi:MAG: efflux RND transporter permease subunit [Tepidisphaeraceae bacterium]|jgi:multidrug efflux pump subunit AcrB
MSCDPGHPAEPPAPEHHFTNRIVKVFLESNLSLVLILLATLLGAAALWLTPREEDPQIIVPLADVYVSFPGHSAAEVEQLVTTPLEKLLYQIDGVEYVYSMSYPDRAIITVRYYVGEDRERSLVKLYKKIDENVDIVPPGVTGWVVKPVEIDDVPIVTLTLASNSADQMTLRRVGEELSQRLAAIKNVSRAYVVGGQPRVVTAYLDSSQMQAYHVSPLEIQRAVSAADVQETAGQFRRDDQLLTVEAGKSLASADELRQLVISTFDGRPVFLKDVAQVRDGAQEVANYVRHGWGPARGFTRTEHFTATLVGQAAIGEIDAASTSGAEPAVTIAIAKKKGSNAVWVANDVLRRAEELKKTVVPGDVQMIVSRNYGLTADEKVNDLVNGLGVAILIVIALLTIGLGWRESLIVAVAVPVVFGLTLAVNLILGFTINRVTLFALILSLGLLVDDPIVDVENISRHFSLRRRATRRIVIDAVSEIRPPLITATLAVIVSFLPMFFITGMMGPYMRPMALNVPVAMLMSMVVAFTITPWLAYHMLKKKYSAGSSAGGHEDPHDMQAVKQTRLYRVFFPLMAPLMRSRTRAWLFLLIIGGLTAAAMSLAATRSVPLKMLPFDNKNELALVLDFDRGTTLERADAAVREFEAYLGRVPEVADFTSYVGVAAPMDFNALVRHYYLRRGDNVAQILINLAGKKQRWQQSHAIGLRTRNDLAAIASRHGVKMKLVETPPGPPVIATLVAEVYGKPDNSYGDLLQAASIVRQRLAMEPGIVDLDDVADAPQRKLVFVTDKEKAAINGITTEQVATTLQIALGGGDAGTVHAPDERNPLLIELRLPIDQRSSPADLARLSVMGAGGQLVPLAEIGHWQETTVDQTIYHKNLHRVAYVFAETAGRPPADAVVDVQADRAQSAALPAGARPKMAGAGGWVQDASPRPPARRTFFSNGSGIAWHVPDGIALNFAGEGEWKITLDVFRDLGLAFAAALLGIYVLLLAQTKSFVIPVVVMLAIPLTVLGVMPGFWLLNKVAGAQVGGYVDPIYFTATGMIGMIALAGIVTRNSIIVVDFIHLSLARGRGLVDAIIESCAVRLRPILLTAGAAMLSAIPIIIDPIFSGLAWTLIFGLFASTLFTLFVIPTVYWLVYAGKPGHGVPPRGLDDEAEMDNAAKVLAST